MYKAGAAWLNCRELRNLMSGDSFFLERLMYEVYSPVGFHVKLAMYKAGAAWLN